MSSQFLGDNRQWVSEVLCIAEAHTSLGTVLGAVASVTLVAGISLMTIL